MGGGPAPSLGPHQTKTINMPEESTLEDIMQGTLNRGNWA